MNHYSFIDNWTIVGCFLLSKSRSVTNVFFFEPSLYGISEQKLCKKVSRKQKDVNGQYFMTTNSNQNWENCWVSGLCLSGYKRNVNWWCETTTIMSLNKCINLVIFQINKTKNKKDQSGMSSFLPIKWRFGLNLLACRF